MQKYFSVVLVLGLVFLSYSLLSERSLVFNAMSEGFDIWKNNLFPALFPFFVISNLLVNFGFAHFLDKLLGRFISNFFNINPKSSFVIIMSIISGFPSSAKYIKEAYDDNLINKLDATKLLLICHFSNPMFVLGTVAITFLNNKNVGLLILLSHYIPNIVIGIILRKYGIKREKEGKSSLYGALKQMHHVRISNQKNIGEIVTNAFVTSINTLLLILGTVTFFLTVSKLISCNINLGIIGNTIICMIFEITSGLKMMSYLDFSLVFKTVLASAFISFGGLSVHMQLFSIMPHLGINYKYFFITRIFHAALSAITCLLLFKVFLF